MNRITNVGELENALALMRRAQEQFATFSQEQVDWFIATLEDARTRGYAVMTMGHYSFGDAPYYSEEKARTLSEK